MGKEPPKSRLNEQIDENLKRVYEDSLKVPVPDRFIALLALLRAKDSDK